MPILNWLDKEKHINSDKLVSYRLLEQDSKFCFGEDTDNMIIQGDNLDALKSLLPYYAGKVKCIYIDPPYNTGNAFSHYDDNLEHSIWLGMMYPRLKLLRELLTEDGVIFVQIDNSPNSKTKHSPEMAYLSVLIDEIFGRRNYITTIHWKKKGNSSNTANTIGTITESIFVYSKNYLKLNLNKEKFDKKYKYNDSYGSYNLEKFLKTDSGEYKRDTMKFDIVCPQTNKIYRPPQGQRWTYGKNTIDELLKNKLLVFENSDIFVKKYNEGDNRKLFKNLFLEEGSLSSAKDELKKLGFNRENFSTPKPELLIKKILDISTNAGDLVLDSFLGSGTTCAVAHKMGRKYIGIEMGNHAKTHCVPRLEKVISGEAGGISKDINWTGGGGFKFYTLGDTVFDEYGKINPVIKFHTLASHIWFYETNNPKDNKYNDMLLGINDNTAYILLYNGILGDKKPQNGNVLTRKILSEIHSKINNHTKGFTGSIVVYGESCRLGENTLQDNNIMFKQTPYDLKI